MRTQIKHWILTLTVAAVLSLTPQAQALYTNYLDEAVGTLSFFSNSLATLPAPNKDEKKQLSQVNKALKDLSKPSASVAGDYNLFFLSVVHLGDLATDPTFDAIGTNAFNAFMAEALAEYGELAMRSAALNDFVKVKKSASNNLFRAQSLLVSLSTETDKQRGLIFGRQLFSRLATVEKLVIKGEEKSGFAASSLAGAALHHEEGNSSGDIAFTDDTHATQTDNQGTQEGTYTYTRTGLDTATLVLAEGSGTTTVKLKFTSETGGTFTRKHVDDEGTESGKGSFSISN